MTLVMQDGRIYTAFLSEKDYDEETKDCILDTVQRMSAVYSSDDRPGMLLGKIQSGKTRTYVGVIALAFDNGYDVAIVFTKGTNALTHQTVARLEDEFEELITYDEVDVFDIMNIRGSGLNQYQMQKKLIIVCKKEDDNLRHLQDLLFATNSDLGRRRTLIIDDEADFASVSYRKEKEETRSGTISGLINELRKALPSDSSFLQVTATPYSLYLQPKGEAQLQNAVFRPTRPAFTVLVPVHDKYVGGDYYFRDSEEPDTVAWCLHKKIDPHEMERLRKPDRRSCKPEEILTDRKVRGLRSAVVTFLVAASIRRIRQRALGEFPRKYSFVVHTDVSKQTHEWQRFLLETLVEKVKEVLAADPAALDPLITEAYEGLAESLSIYQKENPGRPLTPSLNETIQEVRKTFGFLHVTVVNSDNDVNSLLDTRTGELKLTSPYTIFVGGLILDRGLTIRNMIGFFYGRNPQRFQQDTVLQHSRMYGARPKEDLPVTRFYTTERIYEIMKNIHEFDSNLRDEIDKFGTDAGVVFIQRDTQDRIMPCSPNKILISETTNLKPYKRLLPIGFQTGYQSKIGGRVSTIDSLLPNGEPREPFLLDIETAEKIANLIRTTLKFSKSDYKGGRVPGPEFFQELGYSWDVEAFNAAMRYVSSCCNEPSRRDKVWCLVRRNRNNFRIRPGSDRFTNAPDTAHVEGEIAKEWARDVPMLMLFRQNGHKAQGWLGGPFWWPVLYMPAQCRVSVYANETART
ncbi:MAG: hypothetical protein C4521_11635 [Actinobacteria bacterium]|nr:MAG: hypothetical protein C4521_11635 [Actinomycetota bacterium]